MTVANLPTGIAERSLCQQFTFTGPYNVSPTARLMGYNYQFSTCYEVPVSHTLVLVYKQDFFFMGQGREEHDRTCCNETDDVK